MTDDPSASPSTCQASHGTTEALSSGTTTEARRGYEGFYANVRGKNPQVLYVSDGSRLTISYDGHSAVSVCRGRRAQKWVPVADSTSGLMVTEVPLEEAD